MSTDISLREIERRAYRSTFQDGLWDIYLGLMLLGFALASPLESIGLVRPLNILPAVIIPVLFLRYGKKFITVPRIGIVRFGAKRKTDKKRLRIISIILLIVTVTQVVLTLTHVFPPRWMMDMGLYSVPIIIALFAVLVFSIFAYFRDFPRLFWIGVLFGFGILLSEYLHYRVGPPYSAIIGFGVPAIIILTSGLVLLLRFLKKYPKPVVSEVANGN